MGDTDVVGQRACSCVVLFHVIFCSKAQVMTQWSTLPPPRGQVEQLLVEHGTTQIFGLVPRCIRGNKRKQIRNKNEAWNYLGHFSLWVVGMGSMLVQLRHARMKLRLNYTVKVYHLNCSPGACVICSAPDVPCLQRKEEIALILSFVIH